MSKEILTIQNLDDGKFIDKVNESLRRANTSLALADNPKGKATVTVKIAIENSGEDGFFRVVTPTVSLSEPAHVKKATVYPVQRLNGERVIVVDSEQDGDQMKMPGVSDIHEKRQAG